MSPWHATLAIIAGLGGALELWAALLWRDRRYTRRLDAAMRRSARRPCTTCDRQGWLDCHKPPAEWRRCPACHGWGYVKYLEGL